SRQQTVSGALQNKRDRTTNPFPKHSFLAQLLTTHSRQRVELRSPVIVRLTPCGADPAFFLHAIERRIKRTFFHYERLLGALLDALRDGVAMHRSTGECL